jgi:hypothetical protein
MRHHGRIDDPAGPRSGPTYQYPGNIRPDRALMRLTKPRFPPTPFFARYLRRALLAQTEE